MPLEMEHPKIQILVELKLARIAWLVMAIAKPIRFCNWKESNL